MTEKKNQSEAKETIVREEVTNEPEQIAGEWLPPIVSINQIRASIGYAPELALDERTRGGLIQRIRFIQYPTPRVQIALLLRRSFHFRRRTHHRNTNDEKQHPTRQTPPNTLTHFSLSLSPIMLQGSRRERERVTIWDEEITREVEILYVPPSLCSCDSSHLNALTAFIEVLVRVFYGYCLGHSFKRERERDFQRKEKNKEMRVIFRD